MLLVALMYALLASTFTIGKYTLNYSPPFFLVAYRMFLGGGILISYYIWKHKRLPRVAKQDIHWFALVAMIHIFIPFFCEFWAMQFISSIKTNLLYSVTPFVTALLAYFMYSEHLTRKKIIGMIIGFFGLFPVLFGQATPDEINLELFRFSLPEAAIIVAMVSAAGAWFVVKKLMDQQYSLIAINGVAMIAGGVLLACSSVCFEIMPHYAQTHSLSVVTNIQQFLVWATLLTLVANVIVYNFYGWLLKKYSLTFLSFAGFLCPLFGALLGWLFLSEQITVYFIISLLLVGFALYIFYQDELRGSVER